MNIGFFAGPKLAIGSSRGIVLPLAQALRRLGHSPVVLEAGPGRSHFSEDASGVPVWRESLLPHLVSRPLESARAALRRLGVGRGNGPAPDPPGAYDLALGAAQLAAARRHHLDILYTFHNTNVLGVIRNGVPTDLLLAMNLIGFGIDPSRGGASDTFGYQTAIFDRPHWDLHIAASQFEYRQYRDVYNDLDLPPDRLCYLPHPYDVERFYAVPAAERRDLRRRYDEPDERVVLVYPVNVYPRKNIEMAVEVAAILNQKSETTLIVTGRVWDTQYHRDLTRLARARGIESRVRFMRGVTESQMREMYSLANAVIWTSHQETFGLGMIESLACGTPVIGPDWIPPCREILDGQPGGWLAPRDAAPFAEQVHRALGERPDREQIAAEAQRRFGNETVARQFLAEVEPRLERKRARARQVLKTDWRALYENEYDLTGQRRTDDR